MKNYLLKIKELITKQKSVYIPETIPTIEQPKEDIQKIKDIADSLEMEFTLHQLKRIPGYERDNRYFVSSDNLIFFYPLNDGYPTCTFKFVKGRKMVLTNDNEYQEITNLDDILLQLVRLFSKSLDEGIVIDPYYFMIRLENEVDGSYTGSATLVITEKAIRNQKLNEDNFAEATKHFINKFLDHFMGWNFGVSINRNETLKTELEALNEKVINMGIREFAGTGYDVYGTDKESYHGLQHYHLPTEKGQAMQHKKNVR